MAIIGLFTPVIAAWVKTYFREEEDKSPTDKSGAFVCAEHIGSINQFFGYPVDAVKQQLEASMPTAEDVRASESELTLESAEVNDLISLAFREGNAGNHKAALEAVAKVLASNPTHRLALALQGLALLKLERYQESIESFKTVEKQGVLKAPELLLLSRALIMVDLPYEAIQRLKGAVSTDDPKFSVFLLLGVAHGIVGQFKESTDAFEQALSMRNEDIGAHYGLALSYHKLGRFAEALQHYLIVEKAGLTVAGLLSAIALCLYNVNQHERALEYCKRAIEVDRDDDFAVLLYPWLLMLNGKNKEALEASANIPESGRYSEIRFTVRYVALKELGNKEEALRTIEEGLRRFPKNEFVLLCAANANGDCENYKRGLDLFRQYFQLPDPDPEAYMGYGLTASKVGEHEESLEAYRKGIESHPGNATFRYNRACAYSLAGYQDDAFTELRRAISLDEKFRAMAATDSDLEPLHIDSRWKELIS